MAAKDTVSLSLSQPKSPQYIRYRNSIVEIIQQEPMNLGFNVKQTFGCSI